MVIKIIGMNQERYPRWRVSRHSSCNGYRPEQNDWQYQKSLDSCIRVHVT